MVKKSEFFSKHATKSTKIKNWITKILGIVCAVVILAGAYIALNTSVFEVPVIEGAANISGAGEELEEIKTMLKDDDAIDELKDLIDKHEDELSKEEKEMLNDLVDKLDNFAENPSMDNTKAVIDSAMIIKEKGIAGYKFDSVTEEQIENMIGIDGSESAETIEDIDLDAVDEAIESLEEYSEMMKIFDIVMICVWIYAIILAIMAILAGFVKSVTLSVLVTVFSILPSLALVGFWHFLVIVAISVTMIVLIVQMKNAYKRFKKNLSAQELQVSQEVPA